MLPVDNDRDYFGFDENTGGLFNFQGVLANGKEIENIQIGENVTVNYKDNNKYVVSADISKNENNQTILSNISEKWNEQEIRENSAIEGILAMLIASSSGGSSSDESEEIPAESMEYKNTDPDYELPETITPDTGETFDTITAVYRPDNSKFVFSEYATYRSGDFVLYGNTVYICNLYNKSSHTYQGEWNASYFMKGEPTAFKYTDGYYYDYDYQKEEGIEYYHSVTQYFVYEDNRWYKCARTKTNVNSKTWEEAKQQGYFIRLDAGKAPYTELIDVYGIGILNKDEDNEEVTRLIYPDFKQTRLINFDL